jgi:hypothetical protein
MTTAKAKPTRTTERSPRRYLQIPEGASGVMVTARPDGTVDINWGEGDGGFWMLSASDSHVQVRCHYPDDEFFTRAQKLVGGDVKALDASFDIYYGENP